MRTFIATRKAAQVKDRQLTPLSCWTPPNILITPSISCSSLLAQYCILQETERQRERERERKKERKSQSPGTSQISKATEGRGRKSKSVPSAKLTALFLQHRVQAEYQEHAALRIMAGAGSKLQDFKTYAQRPQREKREKGTTKIAGMRWFGFFFLLLI